MGFRWKTANRKQHSIKGINHTYKNQGYVSQQDQASCLYHLTGGCKANREIVYSHIPLSQHCFEFEQALNNNTNDVKLTVLTDDMF